MEALLQNYQNDKNVKLYKFEGKLFFVFEDLQYQIDENVEYDTDDRKIAVLFNEVYKAINAVIKINTLTFKLLLLSNSYNSYPDGYLEISYDDHTKKVKFSIDNCELLFTEAELTKILDVLRF